MTTAGVAGLADAVAVSLASPATPAVVTNASASDNNDTVTVLHTNDVHGHIVEGDYNGVIGDALFQIMHHLKVNVYLF